MEQATGLIKAFTALLSALGVWGTLAVVVAAVLYHEYKERQKSARERTISDEKEAQIQRLADDNRWMRHVLMKKAMGLTDEEILSLTDDRPAQPLLANVKKKEGT